MSFIPASGTLQAGNKLARIPFRLTSVQQLNNVKGLGKSVSAKVKEILTTGRLEKLENFLANEQVQLLLTSVLFLYVGVKVFALTLLHHFVTGADNTSFQFRVGYWS